MRRLLIFLICVYALNASAEGTVIFFGGYGSTVSDTRAWASAAQRSPYGDEFKFIGVPWPKDADGYDSGAALASAGGRSLVEHYVRMIIQEHARDPDHEFVIAGHSSASPLANEIERRLAARPRPTPDFKVRFANLDGFNGQRTRFPSLCVSGIEHLSSCTKNIVQPLGKCRGARGHRNICLHFLILNRAVTRKTTIPTGYARIEPNLSWLEKLTGAVPHDVSRFEAPPDREEPTSSR